MKTLWNQSLSWKRIFSLVFYEFDQLFSKMFVKGCGLSCHNVFQRVEGTLLSDFLSKFLVFQLLSDFQRKLFRLFKKGSVVKTSIYWSTEEYVEIFFLEKVNSEIGLGIPSESHREFGESFWSRLSKLHSKCLEKFSRGSFFDKKSTL